MTPPQQPGGDLEGALSLVTPKPLAVSSESPGALFAIEEVIPEQLTPDQLRLLQELIRTAESHKRYAVLINPEQGALPSRTGTLTPFQAALARVYWHAGLLREQPSRGFFQRALIWGAKKLFPGAIAEAEHDARIYYSRQLSRVDQDIANERARRMERIGEEVRGKTDLENTKYGQLKEGHAGELKTLEAKLASKQIALDTIDKGRPLSELRTNLNTYEGEIRPQLIEDLVALELPRWYDPEFELINEVSKTVKDPLYFITEEYMMRYVRAFFDRANNLKIGPLHAPAGKEGEYEAFLRSVLSGTLVSLVADAENQVDKVYLAVLDHILGTRIPSNPKKVTKAEYESLFKEAVPKETTLRALTILRDSHLRLLDALVEAKRSLSEEHQEAWKLIKESVSVCYANTQVTGLTCVSFEDYLSKSLPVIRAKAYSGQLKQGAVVISDERFGVVNTPDTGASYIHIEFIHDREGKPISVSENVHRNNPRVVCESKEEFLKNNLSPEGHLVHLRRYLLQETEIRGTINAIIDKALSGKGLSRQTMDAKLRAISGIQAYHPTIDVERTFREKWYNAVISKVESMYQGSLAVKPEGPTAVQA